MFLDKVKIECKAGNGGNGVVTDTGSVYVFAQKCNVKLGGIDISLAKFLDMKTFEKYPIEEYMVDEDIIINSTGGGTMGRVGIFHDTDRLNNMKIVPDGHVTIIRACDMVDYKYLYYFIKHNQKYLETQGEGSTNQTELKPITIASLALPLPPLEEQHRISTYLDTKCEKIDSIIARQQEVIEKLKAYKLSVITEAVTKGLNPDVRMKDSGVEWIGDVPEHWETVRIKWLLNERKTKSYSFSFITWYF